MTDLRQGLEELLDEFDAYDDELHKPTLDGPQGLKARLRALLAEAGQPREMSCPACEAVRQVVEVRHMMCTVCHEEFDTPEQLDASLDAVRSAKPAAEQQEPVELTHLRANVQAKRYVDMTPDDGMVSRILSAYIDDSTCTDNMLGVPPDNPLCIAMNEAQAKRNVILRAALSRPADDGLREALRQCVEAITRDAALAAARALLKEEKNRGTSA